MYKGPKIFRKGGNKIRPMLKCDTCHTYRANTIVLPATEQKIVFCDKCLVAELTELYKWRDLSRKRGYQL